ncbi:MAG TPA: F0F1 ATP synthase subunit A [Vicinamibacterales bacterium]|nr:F0F1 ATP synthase subunit A [Vicinamibacterales bacterium]HOG28071.1 F0F1 ATP synthase subunit A [Vicinamibacterales bacterium]HOQ60366.1 F0F1 ATP synthase subunit A [Vicinamibacterales bacterium]HPW20155.1 F0F1 ATP synthase subunit A [Vicinamibacterales bacterium]
MEKLEHELWIVQAANAVFGRMVNAFLGLFGLQAADPAHPIPNYLVMVFLIAALLVALAFLLRSRLSVENPGRLQIVFEDAVNALGGMLDDIVGPKGRRYLPLVATVGVFILCGNLIGLVPGFMAPTSSINVTLGCALTVWIYYHIQGVREQGLLAYLKHFAVPPGAPAFIAPIMLPIEIISHLSRVLSLSLRLFGNIFGEELVIVILFSIVPFVVPLPMMFLGIITGSLQAFIFVMLTMIYLSGAVAAEHGHEDAHAHAHRPARHAEGVAA